MPGLAIFFSIILAAGSQDSLLFTWNGHQRMSTVLPQGHRHSTHCLSGEGGYRPCFVMSPSVKRIHYINDMMLHTECLPDQEQQLKEHTCGPEGTESVKDTVVHLSE